jgi:hypothetical protein
VEFSSYRVGDVGASLLPANWHGNGKENQISNSNSSSSNALSGVDLMFIPSNEPVYLHSLLPSDAMTSVGRLAVAAKSSGDVMLYNRFESAVQSLRNRFAIVSHSLAIALQSPCDYGILVMQ